ncbi:MAG: phage tail protein [Schwartzia sp.]|nr:phage tail protein [Schwartzia sp. (in: firmicutes)]
MPETRSTTLTIAGLNLLARCQTGAELHFARVSMGDGTVPEGTNLKEMTGLVSPKLNLPIMSVRVTGVGTTVMETQLKNESLTQGFFAREVGIFAIDPDTGDEVLYAVRNTGDDSEYIPAGGGSEVWNLIYDVVTVVDQAQNVTANINGDVVYITRVDFYEHRDSANPHPNIPGLRGRVNTTNFFWAQQNGDNHLHPISTDDTRQLLLGDSASSIPMLRSRINQLETELSNVALGMLAEQEMPDTNLLIAEDFASPDMIDELKVKVLSAVSGDNSIDIESNNGIIQGSWVWISDGIRSEYIQIRSVIKHDAVYRILAEQSLTKTYDLTSTYIYRTTASVSNGRVTGAGERRGLAWKPTTTWKGINANVASTLPLNTTQDNADNFTIDGDGEFTSDGFFTLTNEGA